MNKEQLDQAVSEYVTSDDDSLIVTGWVLSVVVKSVRRETGDGYIVEHSDGMPYHSQLGLLNAALDEKRNIVLNQVIKEG